MGTRKHVHIVHIVLVHFVHEHIVHILFVHFVQEHILHIVNVVHLSVHAVAPMMLHFPPL